MRWSLSPARSFFLCKCAMSVRNVLCQSCARNNAKQIGTDTGAERTVWHKEASGMVGEKWKCRIQSAGKGLRGSSHLPLLLLKAFHRPTNQPTHTNHNNWKLCTTGSGPLPVGLHAATKCAIQALAARCSKGAVQGAGATYRHKKPTWRSGEVECLGLKKPWFPYLACIQGVLRIPPRLH